MHDIRTGPLVVRAEGVRLSALPDVKTGAFETQLLPVLKMYRADGMGGVYEIDITPERKDQILSNFGREPRKRIEVNEDHEMFTGDSVGWVYRMWYDEPENMIHCSGNLLPQGEWKARFEVLPYVSPYILFNHFDKRTGKPMGARIANISLTANPFLDWLQPLTLQEQEKYGYVAEVLSPAPAAMRAYVFMADRYPGRVAVEELEPLPEPPAAGLGEGGQPNGAPEGGHAGEAGNVPGSGDTPAAPNGEGEGMDAKLAAQWAAFPPMFRAMCAYELMHSGKLPEGAAQFTEAATAMLAELPDTAYAAVHEGKRYFPLRDKEGKLDADMVLLAVRFSAGTEHAGAAEAVALAAAEAGVVAVAMKVLDAAAEKDLKDSDFAYVGKDADGNTVRKLPIENKEHADNAAARLDQADIPEGAKAAAKKKIEAAQKRFGEKKDTKAAAREAAASSALFTAHLVGKYCDTNPEDDLEPKELEAALEEFRAQFRAALNCSADEDPLVRARIVGRVTKEKMVGRPMTGEAYDALNANFTATQAYAKTLEEENTALRVEMASREKRAATQKLLDNALAARKLNRAEYMDPDTFRFADTMPDKFTKDMDRRQPLYEVDVEGGIMPAGEDNIIDGSVAFSGALEGAGTPHGRRGDTLALERHIAQLRAADPKLGYREAEAMARDKYPHAAKAYDDATIMKSDKGSENVINA